MDRSGLGIMQDVITFRQNAIHPEIQTGRFSFSHSFRYDLREHSPKITKQGHLKNPKNGDGSLFRPILLEFNLDANLAKQGNVLVFHMGIT